MKNLYSLIMLTVILLALPACGKMDVLHNPAPGIDEAPAIHIIKHDATRAGFLQALESWFKKEHIKYAVLPSNADPAEYDWALTYYGRWSWDLALFLSDAEITAYHDGKIVGREKLIVGQWDSKKFEKGEKRIHKMMDMLYNKETHYTPTNTLR